LRKKFSAQKRRARTQEGKTSEQVWKNTRASAAGAI
jgi:hypothetical protein